MVRDILSRVLVACLAMAVAGAVSADEAAAQPTVVLRVTGPLVAKEMLDRNLSTGGAWDAIALPGGLWLVASGWSFV